MRCDEDLQWGLVIAPVVEWIILFWKWHSDEEGWAEYGLLGRIWFKVAGEGMMTYDLNQETTVDWVEGTQIVSTRLCWVLLKY